MEILIGMDNVHKVGEIKTFPLKKCIYNNETLHPKTLSNLTDMSLALNKLKNLKL